MERTVYVVGRQRFLNQLLVDLIRKQITSRCSSVECVSPLIDSPDRAHDDPPLVLINDEESEVKSEIDRLQSGPHGAPRFQGTLALFNVSSGRDICRDVSRGAVKGVFYVEDEIENVIKGIRALLDGDVWVPRKVLVAAATSRVQASEEEEARLTRREMEILIAVSTGATNDEIAQRMFVSAHTVKTHLYNIYRKIGVTNRLHAARWAMAHSHVFPWMNAQIDKVPAALPA